MPKVDRRRMTDIEADNYINRVENKWIQIVHEIGIYFGHKGSYFTTKLHTAHLMQWRIRGREGEWSSKTLKCIRFECGTELRIA